MCFDHSTRSRQRHRVNRHVREWRINVTSLFGRLWSACMRYVKRVKNEPWRDWSSEDSVQYDDVSELQWRVADEDDLTRRQLEWLDDGLGAFGDNDSFTSIESQSLWDCDARLLSEARFLWTILEDDLDVVELLCLDCPVMIFTILECVHEIRVRRLRHLSVNQWGFNEITKCKQPSICDRSETVRQYFLLLFCCIISYEFRWMYLEDFNAVWKVTVDTRSAAK